MMREFSSPPLPSPPTPPNLCFTCFECDLLAEEHSCLCVLGFIPEMLGNYLGPTAATGNGNVMPFPLTTCMLSGDFD